MTKSAIVPESSIEKDVLMAFTPEGEASSIRVAPRPQSDSLLEFLAEEDRRPVGPVRTDRRRPTSTSWASGAWRALASDVAGDGRWFKDLQRLRSRAVGQPSHLRRSPGIISELSTGAEAIMAFVAEDQTSSIRVTPLAQDDPLLEFSSEEDRKPVDADLRPESRPPASEAWPAFLSEILLVTTRCLTWMSISLANLKVGLYERAVGLYERTVRLCERACSLAVALHLRSHSITQRLRPALGSVRAMLSALVVRGDAFAKEVAREGRRCLTWLSTGQADLKVGLRKAAVDVYERAVGLCETAGSLAIAVRVRSHSIGRRLKLAPWPAQATLNAIATRWSVFTLRRTSLSPRAFIQFGCGVAVGVIVTLLLSVRSIPGATMPAPSQPGSLDLGSPVVSVRPPADAPSVGAEQTVTTAGRREPDKTSAVLPSQSQSSAQGDVPSTQRAASPKLARYRGSLAVDSAPTGARVLVNGVPVGTTPLLLKDLPVGSRVVLLELDGYERWSSAVSVVANQRVRAAVDLRRSPSNN